MENTGPILLQTANAVLATTVVMKNLIVKNAVPNALYARTMNQIV